MVDLVDAGGRLAGWDAGEPTDLAVLRNRARHRRHGKQAASAAAALLVAAAVIAGVLLVPGGSSTSVQVGPVGPTFPATPLPPAPPGWSRQAIGAVDLALPPANMVVNDGPTTADAVVCLANECSGVDPLSARDPIIVTPIPRRPVGTPEIIDGLRALVSGQGQRHVFAVPALGVRIQAYGAIGQRIARTLVPSPAAVVTSAGPAAPAPASWRVVHYDGLTVSVPPTWPVIRLRRLPIDRSVSTACDLFFRPALDLGDPRGSCPATDRGGDSPDGLWLGKAALDVGGVTARRLPWVTGADVELSWGDLEDSYLADVTISTPDGVIHATVGLGNDPATIETVLGSIRAAR